MTRHRVAGSRGDAEIIGMPSWLIRPGKIECIGHWPLAQEIYANLTDGLVLPEVMRPVERREADVCRPD